MQMERGVWGVFGWIVSRSQIVRNAKSVNCQSYPKEGMHDDLSIVFLLFALSRLPVFLRLVETCERMT